MAELVSVKLSSVALMSVQFTVRAAISLSLERRASQRATAEGCAAGRRSAPFAGRAYRETSPAWCSASPGDEIALHRPGVPALSPFLHVVGNREGARRQTKTHTRSIATATLIAYG